MWYIKEDWGASDGIGFLAHLFIRPWLAMLALGGLGHRLHITALFIDYWTVWLAIVAARMFISGDGASKWKAAQTKAELE